MKKISIYKGSPERFGYEWKKYSELNPDYEEQFLRWIPFLSPREWSGLNVLDVGCGMGRNSYYALMNGAKSCTSIDVSFKSLNQAKKLLKKFKNKSKVLFCSAYDIEIEKKMDIVFSIGVIHHLEFPEKALKKMVKATKPGGKVIIWVYGLENNKWIVYFFNPLRKILFSKLPISITHHLSLYLTCLLYLYLKLFEQHIEYYKLIKKFKFHHLRSIVFDQMLPIIANYWSKEQVFKLMQDANLTKIRLRHVNETSWAAIGIVK